MTVQGLDERRMGVTGFLTEREHPEENGVNKITDLWARLSARILEHANAVEMVVEEQVASNVRVDEAKRRLF